jgi:hypothetical protein
MKIGTNHLFHFINVDHHRHLPTRKKLLERLKQVWVEYVKAQYTVNNFIFYDENVLKKMQQRMLSGIDCLIN